MKKSIQHPQLLQRPLKTVIATALLWAAGTSLATPVIMPTPMGDMSFDSSFFVSEMLSAPSGQFACFTASELTDCTTASLQVAILGPDLDNGLSLGTDGDITLGFATSGTTLGIWEAGDLGSTIDTRSSLLSVRTSDGWSNELSYGSEKIAHVLNDAEPSGYPTNFSSFAAQDFGLSEGATFDAVRIRSCCSISANLDILAVAAIPEPSSVRLMVMGLFFGLMLVIWPPKRRGHAVTG